jgi:hypothetical protein
MRIGTATSARTNPSPWLIVLASSSLVISAIVHELKILAADFRGETRIFVLLFAPEWTCSS